MYLTVLAIFLWLIEPNNSVSRILVLLDFIWEFLKFIAESDTIRICKKLDRIEEILRELDT